MNKPGWWEPQRWMQQCMDSEGRGDCSHQDLNYYLLMLMMSQLFHTVGFLPHEGESCRSLLKMCSHTPVLLVVSPEHWPSFFVIIYRIGVGQHFNNKCLQKKVISTQLNQAPPHSLLPINAMNEGFKAHKIINQWKILCFSNRAVTDQLLNVCI